jgi:hypothetical protein
MATARGDNGMAAWRAMRLFQNVTVVFHRHTVGMGRRAPLHAAPSDFPCGDTAHGRCRGDGLFLAPALSGHTKI